MKTIFRGAGLCVGAAVLSYVWAGPGAGGGTPASPVVTVEIRKGSAVEGGAGTGHMAGFVLRRVGGHDQSITVSIALQGTAANGIDYKDVPSTVVLPAGGGPVTVVVDVIDDSQDEPDESVVLQVMPGTGYTVGSPAQRTVLILDDDGHAGGGIGGEDTRL